MRRGATRLDARAFGLAAAMIAGALTTICALGLAIAPRGITAVASALIHVDLSEMSRGLTWSSYFGGLFGWTVGAGVVFWAAGALYNRFAGAEEAVRSTERAFAAR